MGLFIRLNMKNSGNSGPDAGTYAPGEKFTVRNEKVSAQVRSGI